jgi:hypothetical protein
VAGTNDLKNQTKAIFSPKIAFTKLAVIVSAASYLVIDVLHYAIKFSGTNQGQIGKNLDICN